MGIETKSSVEIAAAPEHVFAWLCEREKVAQWAGGAADYLPTDSSQLKLGYRGTGTLPAPDGPRPLEVEVTEYDPPRIFSLRTTYAGGDAISSYELSPTESGTRLEISNDTDYGEMARPSTEIAAHLEQVPEAFRGLIEGQMRDTAASIASGAWDDNPMVVSGMQAALDQNLERLKQLVEADQPRS